MARLHKDNDLLRAQLAQLSGSIAAIMDTRSAKAVAESKAREHIKQEAERHAAEKVSAQDAPPTLGQHRATTTKAGASA